MIKLKCLASCCYSNCFAICGDLFRCPSCDWDNVRSRAPTKPLWPLTNQPASQLSSTNQSHLRLCQSRAWLTYHTCHVPCAPIFLTTSDLRQCSLTLPGPISTATWTYNVSNQNQPTPNLYLAARRKFGWCTTSPCYHDRLETLRDYKLQDRNLCMV